MFTAVKRHTTDWITRGITNARNMEIQARFPITISNTSFKTEKEIEMELEEGLESPDILPKDTPSSSETEAGGSNIILETIYDARRVMRSTRKRQRTLFYRIVKGGDTETVDKVVQLLQDKNMDSTLEWLLGLDRTNLSSDELGTAKARCISYIYLLISILVFLIVTPFFYVLHTLLRQFKLGKEVAEADLDQFDLPMAMAAFSGSDEMIALFQKHEVLLNLNL